MIANRFKLKRMSISENRVFINEDLTWARAGLAQQARKLVFEKKVESSWVKGGVILIKLKSGELRKVANPRAFQLVRDSMK
jgi:hypothetical protein